MSFRFENLSVWQKSRAFANAVYGATKHFPRDELFGLTSQIRRAAVSIASNVAEGSERNSDQEFTRFLHIAQASLSEVVTQCHISHDQGYLDESSYKELYTAANELAAMLHGLIRSIRSNDPKRL